MVSRAKYLKALERDLSASRKIIDDLTQENYELKVILRNLQDEKHRTTKHQTR
jgi:DNA polymerase III delta subunit